VTKNVKTALLLGCITLMLFVGIIVRHWFLNR
jgi:hypothetical protein